MYSCNSRRDLLVLLLSALIPYQSDAAFAFNKSVTCPLNIQRFATRASSTTSIASNEPFKNNILILDHLNINHEKGRHDLLKAFYFDFLKCAVDPRKEENLASGRNTLWANIGSNQFHLPEGKPEAQVFAGEITLAYKDIQPLLARVPEAERKLQGSKFQVTHSKNCNFLLVTDPWGTKFRIESKPGAVDTRGSQDGAPSEGLSMTDLTVYVNNDANFAGIARFYEVVFGAEVQVHESKSVKVQVGPFQTLTFKGCSAADHDIDIAHDDLIESEEGISNFGPHVSMYIADLRSSYKKADALGAIYVNPRFKRRAYTMNEAIDQCMFRCIDIVDPDEPAAGPIIKLEHEVRSVIKRDGSKYKSCPFYSIPEVCAKY
mmetsp:Transcript_13732/g.20983  ORF Transcript_13732/g.20983 Transcript_13732/m.20983 type:complete len:375 (+) Transcript_13732:134-1258(+)